MVRTAPSRKASTSRRAAPRKAARPDNDAERIDAIARRWRAKVRKRALIAATAAAVPIPGLDLAVDLGLMVRMMDEINEAFGLTPAQIEALAPEERLTTYGAIAAVGSSLVGRAITSQMLKLLLKRVAKRLAAATVIRYVPFAGQAVAAGISYVALKYVGNRHIEDCVAVAELLAAGASGTASAEAAVRTRRTRAAHQPGS